MGRYSAAHVVTRGPGDARPTALQIIQDESLEGKLLDKTIVLTGASSGIGLETARALHKTGAKLILPCRDMKKAEHALSDILDHDQVQLVEMDNASFASIHRATAEVLKLSNNRINILINNAGLTGIPDLQLTQDGHELSFETNYLSNFLLFQLLKPALLSSSTSKFHSRVVNVSSSAHRSCFLPSSDNYNFEKGEYNFLAAYSNSKLAQIYMTNYIDRCYGSRGLHANSLHPGGILTDIGRHMDKSLFESIMNDEKIFKGLKSPEQGAATTVWAAIGREWEGKGGKYLEDCEEAQEGIDDMDYVGKGYVRQTYDIEEETRLWKDSLKIVGMTDDDVES